MICADGTTAGVATTGSTATSCTNCDANTFCDNPTAYGSSDIAPVACPTGTTAPAGSDSLSDCICTDATKTLDTTSNTAGCVATYTGTGGNCRTFLVAAAGTCTLCRDGYRLSNNVCVACAVTNCQLCDSSGTVPAAGSEKCTKAKTGYYLNATNVPTACPANCTWCSSTDGTVIVCTGVAANYYVSSTATGVATACTAGLSSLATATGMTASTFATAALGCTIVCSTNCQNCAVNGAA